MKNINFKTLVICLFLEFVFLLVGVLGIVDQYMLASIIILFPFVGYPLVLLFLLLWLNFRPQGA